MTKIDINNINSIAIKITPIFDKVLNEYDFGKYPSEPYTKFKDSFDALDCSKNDISDAMIWKWGHWGKPNFPQHHKNLIREIQILWPKYIASSVNNTSQQTFNWWSFQLNRQTAYITTAFITHLVHHQEPLPIIDQHNFRAMNSFLIDEGVIYTSKKKPSNWEDIVALKDFMTLIQVALPSKSFSELDRFLMMYGRNYATR